MSRFIWLAMFAGVLATSGCTSKPTEQKPGNVTTDDVRRESGEAVDSAVDLSQQTKDEFQQDLDARLKELDIKIAKMREQGRDLKDQAKLDWDRRIAEVDARREALRTQLEELSQSSGEAWRDVQKGVESAWKELDQAFHEASSEFDDQSKP